LTFTHQSGVKVDLFALELWLNKIQPIPTYVKNIRPSKITDTDKAYQSFSKKT